MASKRRVVITGMGLASCFGTEPEVFYRRLLAGDSGVAPITEFQVDDLPTRFAAWVKDFEPGELIDPKLARRGDPFLIYGVYAGKRALMDGGLLDEAARAKLNLDRCGVVLGSGMGGMTIYTESCKTLEEKGIRRLSPFFVPYILTNMAGGLLAIDIGFKGPNYSISTACATSSYSLIAAADYIRNGVADVMLAGGVEGSKNRMCVAGFVACRALSERNDDPTKASRPWDQDRDGFVIGEGGGVFLLEEYEHAKKRGAHIYAEYLGGAINCDAYHMTSSREDGSTIGGCIEAALKDAHITSEEVDYVNAHATSTTVGDEAELAGMMRVFGRNKKKPLVNATKSMIGHALGGAGSLEIVGVLQQMKHGILHPTINLHRPIENLAFDVIPNQPREHHIKVAVKSSFGFGGHNAVIVLGRAG